MNKHFRTLTKSIKRQDRRWAHQNDMADAPLIWKDITQEAQDAIFAPDCLSNQNIQLSQSINDITRQSFKRWGRQFDGFRGFEHGTESELDSHHDNEEWLWKPPLQSGKPRASAIIWLLRH
jgi:hypothetical protein